MQVVGNITGGTTLKNLRRREKRSVQAVFIRKMENTLEQSTDSPNFVPCGRVLTVLATSRRLAKLRRSVCLPMPKAGALPLLSQVAAAQYVRMSTEHQRYFTENQAMPSCATLACAAADLPHPI